jgi:hypothetical protein
MKKHIRAVFKTGVLALLFLLPATKIFAGDDLTIEKKKTYNKTYPLTGSQKVSIKNSFGTVQINSYKGSEVKVEVTVIAKASTDERAQDILDNISISDNGGSTVSFETKMGNNNNNNNRGRKNESQSMEVNYVVSMPEGNPLTVQNEFGKTVLGDRSGLTDITEKFGELEVGTLTNVDQVKVEFGSIKAEKLVGGKTSFSYSEVKINSFGGAVKTSLEFCSKTKLGITNEVTDVNISNSYSDIELSFPASFNGTFAIHTSFGDFDNDSPFKIKEEGEDDEDHGPKFDNDYAGVSGNGSCKVKIKSSFGKIRFR